MPDASPAADADGLEPDGDEGQKPDENGDDTNADEPRSRTYPESYVKQLRREASSYRSKMTELEERLQEHEDAQKTEQERISERAAEAERRAVEAETRILRYEVAAEYGLDAAAAAFLTGSSREEIEHRAEELTKLLKEKGKPAAAGFDGGARKPAPAKQSPEVAHNETLLDLFGRPRQRS